MKIAVAGGTGLTGRHVIEVRPGHVADVLALVGPSTLLGTVSAEPALALPGLPAIAVATLATAFHGADA